MHIIIRLCILVCFGRDMLCNLIGETNLPLTCPDMYQKSPLTLYISVRPTTQVCRAACLVTGHGIHRIIWKHKPISAQIMYKKETKTVQPGKLGGREASQLPHPPPFDSSTAMFVYRLLYHSVNCVITVSIYYVWGQMDTYIKCHEEHRQTCIFYHVHKMSWRK